MRLLKQHLDKEGIRSKQRIDRYGRRVGGQHPELGPITLPTTPLRLHGLGKAPAGASPRVGEHNDEIYGGWLGLSAADLAALKEEGVI